MLHMESEHYDRHMYEAFDGLSGFCCIVDDIVIDDSDATQPATHVQTFLQRCAEKNITLNLEKYKFFESSVTFARFQLSPTGYQVDKSMPSQSLQNLQTVLTFDLPLV